MFGKKKRHSRNLQDMTDLLRIYKISCLSLAGSVDDTEVDNEIEETLLLEEEIMKIVK